MEAGIVHSLLSFLSGWFFFPNSYTVSPEQTNVLNHNQNHLEMVSFWISPWALNHPSILCFKQKSLLGKHTSTSYTYTLLRPKPRGEGVSSLCQLPAAFSGLWWPGPYPPLGPFTVCITQPCHQLYHTTLSKWMVKHHNDTTELHRLNMPDTGVVLFFTVVELVPKTWMQLHLQFQRSYSSGISPRECYKTHTQSIPLYGNTTTPTQQRRGPKIQAWTWVSASWAHKTSVISRCSKHTLIIQNVTSQASRPHIATLTGDTGIKKEVYQDWGGEESPKLFCVGGVA